MRKSAALFLLIFLLFQYASAQDQFLNLSLIKPVSLTAKQKKEINCNISVLHSHQNSLRGFGLSGGLQLYDSTAKGIQISLIGSYSGASAQGLVISGLANISLRAQKGIFIAGLANMSFHEMKGLQIAALNNFVAESGKGVQLSSAYNMAAGEFKGLQITGLMNISNGKMNGYQIATGANLCLSEYRGLQLAAFNFSGDLHGVQFGLANIASKVKGVQIGLVNYSKDFSGVNIGLVNLSGKTKTQMLVGGGNAAYSSLAVRFLNKSFYSQIGIGSPIPELSEEYTGSLSYRYGAYFSLTEKLHAFTDAGFLHLMQYDTDELDYSLGFALQTRAGLEYDINNWFGVYAAAGYQWLSKSYKSVDFENKVIFEFGVVLF